MRGFPTAPRVAHMKPHDDSLFRFVVEGCNVRGQLVYLDESWRALAINMNVLAPNHPYVARTLDSLAALYRAQGRYPPSPPGRSAIPAGESS